MAGRDPAIHDFRWSLPWIARITPGTARKGRLSGAGMTMSWKSAEEWRLI
jgi:hypothetical protein